MPIHKRVAREDEALQPTVRSPQQLRYSSPHRQITEEKQCVGCILTLNYLEESREGKEDSKRKVTQAKTHSNASANLPGVHPNIPGKTAALAWFELCLNYI